MPFPSFFLLMQKCGRASYKSFGNASQNYFHDVKINFHDVKIVLSQIGHNRLITALL